MTNQDESCLNCIYAEHLDPMNDLIYCTETGQNHLNDFWCKKYEYNNYKTI